MKKKIIIFLIIVVLILIFLIFLKGLNKSNLYQPKSSINNVPEFSAITFFKKEDVNSKNIFDQKKFYLLNIWASWCSPCKDEHHLLVNLSKNDRLEVIGLNYKDRYNNAEKFLNELGNPYEKIMFDKDGVKSIEWGAFGVPESFLIYNNKVVEKYIGPLNKELIKKIKLLIK